MHSFMVGAFHARFCSPVLKRRKLTKAILSSAGACHLGWRMGELELKDQRDGLTKGGLHEYFVHEFMVPLEPRQCQCSCRDHFFF